jgi:hypothetical protein
MADDAQTSYSSNPYPDNANAIRSIHWREVFPFLHIFRAFRIAVHPSKLVLGLVALLSLYAGGRIMDAVWPQPYKANYGEAAEYERYSAQAQPIGTFQNQIDRTRREMQHEYATRLLAEKIIPATQPGQAEEDAAEFKHVGEVKSAIVDARDAAISDADKGLEAAYKLADAAYDDVMNGTDAEAKDAAAATRDRDKRQARDLQAAAITSAMNAARASEQELRMLVPRGVFDEFFNYETTQVNAVTSGVLADNWTGGLTAPGAAPATGVVAAVKDFFVTGPGWLVRYHYVYFILFFALFLLVWAVFGGAIARIAAVHAARDEKISVRQALRFSSNKVLSYVFAPVIPLGIALFIGVLLAAGGLLFYVPWIGPIVAGALLVLALVGGVLITLVLIGTLGGLNLMYPTVAAEGSDSFDAISRSFSYVYARPWRMLFYTAVSIAYGAITYLFVKLFIYLVLAVTHYFVGWWLVAAPGRWYSEMWPAPGFESLPYEVNFTGLKFTEKTAAFLICFWNYLLIGLLGAFAISFYFSANSIIYFLMRREVDATELDDVYVEEADDDLSEPAPVAAGAPADGPVTTTISLQQFSVQADAAAPAAPSETLKPGETPQG